jgi:hypothetical protein
MTKNETTETPTTGTTPGAVSATPPDHEPSAPAGPQPAAQSGTESAAPNEIPPPAPPGAPVAAPPKILPPAPPAFPPPAPPGPPVATPLPPPPPPPATITKSVYVLAALLLAFPLLYSIDWKVTDWKFWTYRLTLGAPALFIFLALVPGVLAIVYHLVTVVQRRTQNQQVVDAYYAWLDGRSRAHQQGLKRLDDVFSGPVSANAATVLLVAVFLFVAVMAGYSGTKDGLQGIVYAGLGAYISVLYFMVSRLYASALSSRFLMSSAIGSASAVVMGWVFAMVSTNVFGPDAKSLNLPMVLFLTGLFHKWAFDALRRRARTLFGQPNPDTTELPINSIEGIDDVHADLLTEYGVSTVQHLATAEPGELCERTLLPLDRIAEWMDQAILIMCLNKNVAAARSLGIRGAIDLILIYNEAEPAGGPMSKLLDSLGEKITMPRASIDAIARKLRDDYTVGLVFALREGRDLPRTAPVDTLVPRVAQELETRYDFLSGVPEAPVPMRLKLRP